MGHTLPLMKFLCRSVHNFLNKPTPQECKRKVTKTCDLCDHCCDCKSHHYVKCAPVSSFFVPFTAVVIGSITNLVLKNYWRPIEGLFMLIVSRFAERQATRQQRLYTPLTFDLQLISLPLCFCWLLKQQLQLSMLHLHAPPSSRQSTHTRCLHGKDMCGWFAYQYIHPSIYVMF